jgi:hypothetical protein
LSGPSLGAHLRRGDDRKACTAEVGSGGRWSVTPASRWLSVANKRGWDLCWCKREARAARVCGEKWPEVDLAVCTDGAAMAAARAGAPTSLQLGLGNKGPGQLQWCERKGVGHAFARKASGARGSAVTFKGAPRRSRPAAGKRKHARGIARAPL